MPDAPEVPDAPDVPGKVERGRAWWTPFAALGGTALVIAVVFGIVVAIAIVVYALA